MAVWELKGVGHLPSMDFRRFQGFRDQPCSVVGVGVGVGVWVWEGKPMPRAMRNSCKKTAAPAISVAARFVVPHRTLMYAHRRRVHSRPSIPLATPTGLGSTHPQPSLKGVGQGPQERPDGGKVGTPPPTTKPSKKKI